MVRELQPHLPLLAAIFAGVVVLAIAGRVPLLRRLLSLGLLAVLAWLGVLLLGERARFDPVLGGVADLLQPGRQQVTGGEVRVPMGRDGHFWVQARLNGVPVRLLVDSGATVTALSTDTAQAAGLDVRASTVPIVLRTANGTVPAQTTDVRELTLGSITARDLSAVVSPSFGGMDVLGMNFLSRLKGWRVEDGTLVLVPHHPQPVAAEPAPKSWLDRLRKVGTG